jgi:hypothetical protein
MSPAERAAARALAEPRPRRAGEESDLADRPDLRVVPEARPRRVGVVVFLAGVALFGSLFGLAVFHAMLVQSQSTLDDLDGRLTEARGQSEELRLEIAELEAPDRILDEARDRGMIPADDVVVLDATDGAGDDAGSASTSSAPTAGAPTADGEPNGEGAEG